jgi:hypothetical protein
MSLLLLIHFCMSMKHVLAAYLCCMSMLLVLSACPCCMSVLHVRAVCPCCMSVLHAYSACPHCTSMLHERMKETFFVVKHREKIKRHLPLCSLFCSTLIFFVCMWPAQEMMLTNFCCLYTKTYFCKLLHTKL